MSVLIRGMKMPKNCAECPCLDDEYFWCKAVNRQPDDENIIERRPDWCPLIELLSHGPLIDMDDFLQEWSELESYRTAMELCEVIEAEPCNDLAKPNNAPTVIEADYPPSVPLEQVWTELFGEDGE